MTAPTEPSQEVIEGLREGAKAFLPSLITAAEDAGPAPDPLVSVAFALGWQMAELYEPQAWPASPPKPEPDLPGLSQLSGSQRAGIGLDQIDVALKQLKDSIEGPGLTVPVTKGARDALVNAKPTDAAFRDALFALHIELLQTLTAADFRLGKAYGLGRALADTARAGKDLKSLTAELERHRVATLSGWLSDLSSAFPAHAAQPVNTSLQRWRDWAAKPKRNQGEDDTHIIRLLRRQGGRWRALLSGERRATEMLQLQDYVLAGSSMIGRMWSLTWRFLWRYALLIVFAILLFAAGVWLILDNSDAAHIAAGIGGLLASIGLTWKGAGTSLGKAAGRLERPVWEAALDEQIVEAMTLLPGSKRVKGYTPPQ